MGDSLRIPLHTSPRPKMGFSDFQEDVALSDVVADGTFWRPRPIGGMGRWVGDALFWSGSGEVGGCSPISH